jgi:type II secretory pathway pseudopilin PulG
VIKPSTPATTHQGFNLIEVLLAISFFSLAFSGMLLGSTAILQSNNKAFKVSQDTAVMGQLFRGVVPQSAYIEIGKAVADTLTQTPTNFSKTTGNWSFANLPGDVATVSTLVLPDETGATNDDNRRVYYSRFVYSQKDYADVKTVQVNLFKTATSTNPYQVFTKRLDLRKQCLAMGWESMVRLDDGTVCTPMYAGLRAPKFSSSNMSQPLGASNRYRTFGVAPNNTIGTTSLANGTSVVSTFTNGTGTLSPLYEKAHQGVGNTISYELEGSIGVPYKISIGLNKRDAAQAYQININTSPADDVACNLANPGMRCNSVTETISAAQLGSLAINDMFVKEYMLTPYGDANGQHFRITISTTAGANPVVHFIRKEPV